MNIQELEEHFSKINKELYSFAYSLNPDELQAEQIVIDAIQALLLDKKDSIGDFLDCVSKMDMEKILFRNIFVLATKRNQNIKQSRLSVEDKWQPYYSLSLSERAILYLKHHTSFDYDTIEEIVNLFRHELISTLITGRQKLMENMGEEYVIRRK